MRQAERGGGIHRQLAHQGANFGDGAGIVRHLDVDPVLQVAECHIRDVVQQALFCREVVEEGAARDICGFGDIVDGGCIESLCLEQVGSRFEQPLSVLLLLALAPGKGCVCHWASFENGEWRMVNG